jgi:hypothetical protein
MPEILSQPSGVISVGETVSLFWNSLGVFRHLFALALAAIAVFLWRGWRQLHDAVCPFDFSRPLGQAEVDALHQCVHEGATQVEVAARFFGGSERGRSNLFCTFITRFAGCRDTAELPPSVAEATDELHRIACIQRLAATARFLSALLPAIGLLGTLIGMFNAFFGTDFTQGDEIGATMQQLMKNFSLALFTTIAAVLLKIGVDLFNHFTLETYVTRARDDLLRLRALLLDLRLRPLAPASEPASVEDRTTGGAPTEAAPPAPVVATTLPHAEPLEVPG